MIRDEPLSDETFWEGYNQAVRESYTQAGREGWADVFAYEWFLQDRPRPLLWTGEWPPPIIEKVKAALADYFAPPSSSLMDDVHSRLVQR